MSEFTFAIAPGMFSEDVRIRYIPHDYSFFCENAPPTRGISIVVNDVELCLEDDGRVAYICGYCPDVAWKPTSAAVPRAARAGLMVSNLNPADEQTGMAFGLGNRAQNWPLFVNGDGWACVGDPTRSGDAAVEFAPGCVAILERQSLKALWIQVVIAGSSAAS